MLGVPRALPMRSGFGAPAFTPGSLGPFLYRDVGNGRVYGYAGSWFRLGQGVLDVAITGTASQSSTPDGGKPASRAIDSNDATDSVLTGSAQTWKVDLGSAKAIRFFRVLGASNYRVQYSFDNTNWNETDGVGRGVDGSVTDSGILPITGAITARYWRLQFTATGGFQQVFTVSFFTAV